MGVGGEISLPSGAAMEELVDFIHLIYSITQMAATVRMGRVGG